MGKTGDSSLIQHGDGSVAEVSREGCPAAPKLDPRVRRTRKLLESSLRELLREKSYDDISVGDIAERATVNRATFYAHFLDKQDLATTMLREDLETALLVGFIDRGPLTAERLVAVATAYFQFMGRTLGQCPKRGDELCAHIGPTLQAGLQDFLSTWLEHDPAGLRPFRGASRDAIVTVLSWSLYGAAQRWSHNHKKISAEESARETVALLLP